MEKRMNNWVVMYFNSDQFRDVVEYLYATQRSREWTGEVMIARDGTPMIVWHLARTGRYAVDVLR